MLAHLDELVVKEVHGAGGYGMLVGPAGHGGRARGIPRPHPRHAGQVHRAADARAVDLPDLRRRRRRAAAHRPAAVRAVGRHGQRRAGRPDARRAARRARWSSIRRRAAAPRTPGWWPPDAVPHRQRSVLDGAPHRARREHRAPARRDLPHVAAAVPDAASRASPGPSRGRCRWSPRDSRRRTTRKYTKLSAEDVLRYMILDSDNPSSIYSCLRAARESARDRARRDHLRDVRGPELGLARDADQGLQPAAGPWRAASSSTG